MRVVVLTDIEPAVIRGVRSQGMLLGADCGAAPALLTVDRAVENGSPVQ